MITSSAPRPGAAAPARAPRRRVLPRIVRHRAPHGALLALALFAAVRVAGIAAVISANALTGRPLVRSLAHSWDSRWYLNIAAHGYGRLIWITPTGGVQSDWAFFPLYPALVRAADTVLPVGLAAAALLVAWTAAVVAAYGVYLIGHHLYGRAAATALVALWAVLPHAVELTIAYTESLFAALAAWSLYSVLKERWLWAGGLALAAGLARPTGFAVAVAVIAAAALRLRPGRDRAAPAVWAGAAVAPAGWLGYVLWVGHRTGDLTGGYFSVQGAWGSRVDFGAGAARFVGALLAHGGQVVYPVALVVVLVGVVLFGLLCAERAPLPLVVFAGVLVLLVVLGSGSFSSKPRFLLPAFPLLIPPALAFARAWRTRPVAPLLVGGALALLSVLYGAYVTVVVHSPL
ncbi:hypothetical protein [Streptomyces sp. NPDC046860]|uniref:hypothetical protein n=1 Tax=Streptomyces sp. NPDC046860 TaxID=3154495 RepID=UPI0033E91F1D